MHCTRQAALTVGSVSQLQMVFRLALQGNEPKEAADAVKVFRQFKDPRVALKFGPLVGHRRIRQPCQVRVQGRGEIGRERAPRGTPEG